MFFVLCTQLADMPGSDSANGVSTMPGAPLRDVQLSTLPTGWQELGSYPVHTAGSLSNCSSGAALDVSQLAAVSDDSDDLDGASADAVTPSELSRPQTAASDGSDSQVWPSRQH